MFRRGDFAFSQVWYLCDLAEFVFALDWSERGVTMWITERGVEIGGGVPVAGGFPLAGGFNGLNAGLGLNAGFGHAYGGYGGLGAAGREAALRGEGAFTVQCDR